MTIRRLSIGLLLHSNIRSGGNLALLQHCAYLAECGHRVEVIFQEAFFGCDIAHAGLDLPSAHLADRRNDDPFDLALTNWWECAYRFAQLPARQYAYFCHGEEPLLYPDRSYELCIDTVFRDRIELFAVNPHLARRLERISDRPVRIVPNGVHIAHSQSAEPYFPPEPGRLRVLIEGPAGVPWKRVPETVALLKSIDGLDLVHVSADGSTDPAWQIKSLANVPYREMAGVYKSCDVVVKLSTSPEASPMPVLEGFAAGATAIVTAFPGPELYVRDGHNALVVPVDDPIAARRAVESLRDDRALLARLRVNATATARRFDWRDVSRQFAEMLGARIPDADASVVRLPLLDRYRDCYLAILATQIRLATRS
jgi:O-antigen biosynthesis protein